MRRSAPRAQAGRRDVESGLEVITCFKSVNARRAEYSRSAKRGRRWEGIGEMGETGLNGTRHGQRPMFSLGLIVRSDVAAFLHLHQRQANQSGKQDSRSEIAGRAKVRRPIFPIPPIPSYPLLSPALVLQSGSAYA